MPTPEPRYNPDNDSPDCDGVTCRGCGHFVLDASDEEAHEMNGWQWCNTCYFDLPEVIAALGAIAARGDFE